MDRDLKIGSLVKFDDIIEHKKVDLKVVKSPAAGICSGCYFFTARRHCPEQWACGEDARTDRTPIIFKEMK